MRKTIVLIYYLQFINLLLFYLLVSDFLQYFSIKLSILILLFTIINILFIVLNKKTLNKSKLYVLNKIIFSTVFILFLMMNAYLFSWNRTINALAKEQYESETIRLYENLQFNNKRDNSEGNIAYYSEDIDNDSLINYYESFYEDDLVSNFIPLNDIVTLSNSIHNGDYLNYIIPDSNLEQIRYYDKTGLLYLMPVRTKSIITKVGKEVPDLTNTTSFVFTVIDSRSNDKNSKSVSLATYLVRLKDQNVLYVTSLPENLQLKNACTQEQSKISDIFTFGINCAIDSINSEYDLDIYYYLKFDLNSFRPYFDINRNIFVELDDIKNLNCQINCEYKLLPGQNRVSSRIAQLLLRDTKSHNESEDKFDVAMLLVNGLASNLISNNITFRYSDLLESLEQSIVTNIPNKFLKKIFSIIYIRNTDLVTEQINLKLTDSHINLPNYGNMTIKTTIIDNEQVKLLQSIYR